MILIDALHPALTAILFLATFSAFAVIGVLVKQRFARRLRWRENDVVGFVIAVVGVVYGVILAMIAIAVWERYETVEMAVTNEASAAADLYRGFEGYDQPARDQLQARVTAYLVAVTEDEWPAMSDRRGTTAANQAVESLASAIVRHDPVNTREEWLHGQTLTELDLLLDQRRLRLEKGTEGLPGAMWLVVIVGGLITIAYTFLFNLESLSLHVLLTVLLAATTGLVVFLVYSMAEPLAGGVAIQPAPFLEALEAMRAGR